MWYVVQVRTGTEENIRAQCRRKVSPDVLESCFIPYYEEKKRIRGRWITQRKILFPGYIFAATREIEKLHMEMKHVLGLSRLLGTGDEIVPLTQDEEDFLRTLGGEEHVVPVSEGVIEGTVVKVYAGPLKGMEGSIRKIDRHKRKAWLEIPLFGRVQQVEVGLEIVKKTG